MNVSKTILEYREHLITRTLARNMLLHFYPQKKGGGRIDVSDAFGSNRWAEGDQDDEENPPSANLLWQGNQPEEEHVEEKNFLQELMEKGKVTVDLGKKLDMISRMLRMKQDADVANRTLGVHSLFLGWPFIFVRREGKKSIAAPLMFFGVKFSFQGNKVTIEKIPEIFSHNYMLKAWLEWDRKEGFSQKDLSLDGDVTFSDRAKTAEIIKKFSGSLQGCHCEISTEHDSVFRLHQYNGDAIPNGHSISVMPFAVFGITKFKYKSLLDDLKALAQESEGNQEMGLLDNFLGTSKNINLGNENLSHLEESDKYFVEESDPSQEAVVAKLRRTDIMLIDGPPGSGKSQTIVNLIADALQRGESVALVCEKITALRVVEKRLEAKGLGHLVLTVTDPSGQRTDIIRRMKKVGDEKTDGLDLFERGLGIRETPRENLSQSISRNEHYCDAINASRGEHPHYSVRGDLLGKIRKITNETGFDLYHSRNDDFVGELKASIKNPSDCTDDLNRLELFVDNYNDSNYPHNKWQHAFVSSDAADKIRNSMRALLPQAKKLHEQKHILPSKEITSLLSHPLMRKWAGGFLDSSERQDIIDNIFYLMKGMASAYELAGIAKSVLFVRDDIYADEGNIYETIRLYHDDATHLEKISDVNEQIRENQIIKTFLQHPKSVGIPRRHWTGIMSAVIYLIKKESLPQSVNLSLLERRKQDMKVALEQKRALDIKEICLTYSSRRDEAAIMQKKGLMRIKRFQNQMHTTVRDMLTKGKSSFQKIFPVLLTTPDVMSQIFPLEKGGLNMVIVDEASQMFVAEALPIIYRTQKLVVSGDKMQMPPSDDFAYHEVYDDNDDDDSQQEEGEQVFTKSPELLEAMENIIPTGPFRSRLDTHYRSRPAELFHFSNHAFYDGTMQIPPDNIGLPTPLERPIQIVDVAGKIKNSVNRAEISRIIQLLHEIWQVNSSLSVGVIVFNEKQKSALEDALYEESANNDSFKSMWKASREKEDDGEDVGFFVRSIHQAQGDERDVIILGTTYDDNSRRYGLLTRSNRGRRILNVAITRAKEGMYIISSLNIDNVSHEGERPGTEQSSERWYLWKFLQYAQAVSNGDSKQAKEIIHSLKEGGGIHDSVGAADSQFEIDVADYINTLGYQAVPQVGESGFKIDIGVKIADESRYLCGIECDGRRFHEGWRARHNDIWRQKILEGKDWDIHRIWSDHWYDSTEREQKKLREHLDQLKQNEQLKQKRKAG